MDVRGIWRTEPGAVLSAEVDGLRLVVQAPTEAGGAVRFLVLRRGAGERADTLIGSGTGTDVRAAMAAAERMAERFVARPPTQGI